MQKPRTTIKDVAREAGVNISTASRALAGSYGVHKTTREKVLCAAQLLKYQPNFMARGLVTGRSNTIGLLITDIRNPFFADVARGVEDAAHAAGVQVFIGSSDMDPGRQMGYFHAMRTRQVDGVIMASIAHLNAAQQMELATADIPVVLLNGSTERNARFCSVCADNFSGGYIAGQYLIGLGHRRIGHIAGPPNHENLALRCEGFLDACEPLGGSVTPIVLHGEHTYEGGYEMTNRMFSHTPSPTALFAANDIMAFGALRALKEMGLRAPADISVIGFDDLDLDNVVSPSLSTIRQPRYDIGQAAVQLLLQPRKTLERRVLGVELIERGSCCAVENHYGGSLRSATAISGE